MSNSHNVPPPLGLPLGRMPELRGMPGPADANVYGDVFGGWIMAQVDIAGSMPATRRADGGELARAAGASPEELAFAAKAAL